MRRSILSTTGAAVMAGALLVGCGNGDGDGDPGDLPATQAPADTEPEEAGDVTVTPQLAGDLAAMRAATAGYANDLDAALGDGFFIITQMIDDMGYHYLNPDFSADGFDPSEPPILVYVRDDEGWQLVAVEWVFPEEPAEAPVEGASYGAFPAACHYQDGLFVEAATEDDCADAHPDSEAGFTFWHPELVTLHAWIWQHNPEGLYHGTNPLMSAYSDGQG